MGFDCDRDRQVSDRQDQVRVTVEESRRGPASESDSSNLFCGDEYVAANVRGGGAVLGDQSSSKEESRRGSESEAESTSPCGDEYVAAVTAANAGEGGAVLGYQSSSPGDMWRSTWTGKTCKPCVTVSVPVKTGLSLRLKAPDISDASSNIAPGSCEASCKEGCSSSDGISYLHAGALPLSFARHRPPLS